MEVGVGGVVAPEAKDTGVHNLRADAVKVLIFEPCGGIPGAGSCVIIAEAGHVDFLALGFVGGCTALAGESDSELAEAFHDVEVTGVPGLDVRRLFSEFPVHSGREQVLGLHDVSIRRNVASVKRSCHGSPPEFVHL